jgi:hypothetical protein
VWATDKIRSKETISHPLPDTMRADNKKPVVEKGALQAPM